MNTIITYEVEAPRRSFESLPVAPQRARTITHNAKQTENKISADAAVKKPDNTAELLKHQEQMQAM